MDTKKKYAIRKAAGICVSCHERPAEKGRTLCHECRESKRKKEKERRMKRKAAGTCVRCGERKAVKGRTLCKECAKKNIQTQRTRRRTTYQVNKAEEKGVICKPGYMCLDCPWPDCINRSCGETKEEKAMRRCGMANMNITEDG